MTFLPKIRLRRNLFAPAVLLLSGSLGLSIVSAGEPAAESPGETKIAPPPPADEASVVAEIDRLIAARLAAAQVEAAPPADDETFARRVFLDLVGAVPTLEALDAFLLDKRPDKRARLVAALQGTPEHADYQAMWWFRTLTGVGVHAGGMREGQGARNLGGTNGERFHGWLAEQIGAGRPYDEWVVDLVTATGRTDEVPAAVYLARWEGEPNNTIGAIAKQFLGLRIQCAQCHDHIYEETWKQADFQGMASFVAPLAVRRVPEYQQLRALQQKLERRRGSESSGSAAGGADGSEAPDGEAALTAEERAELRRLADYRVAMDVADTDPNGILARRLRRNANPDNVPEALRGRMELLDVAPKLWLDAKLEDVPGISRRLLLARWIVAPENPYFARTVANRYWGAHMGRGLVDPVDDFTSFLPPSHPEVLALLEADVRASGYDLRRLQRIVLATEAYGRASTWKGEAPDPALFAKAPVRPLSTEQFTLSLVRATGLEGATRGPALREGRNLGQSIGRLFSFVFDDDENAESEDFQGSIPQGLFLLNSEMIQRGLSAMRGMPLDRMLAEHRTDESRIERLWRAAYARKPSASERKAAMRFVAGAANERSGYEDLLWALVNSAEFMTNH